MLMSNAMLLFMFLPVYLKVQRIINLLQKLLINKEKKRELKAKQTNRLFFVAEERTDAQREGRQKTTH